MSTPPPPTAPPSADEATSGVGQPPPARRLTRQRRGRLIGGVARGLARYLGVDPVVVRIGFVVLAFVPFPGFGVLLYAAMLLLVPEEDADGAVVPTRLAERTPAFWVGVGLVGLATFALLGVVGQGRFGGLLPLLLIGLGVALWVDADRRPADGPASPAGSASPPAWAAPAADAAGGVTEPAAEATERANEPVAETAAGAGATRPTAGAADTRAWQPPPVPPSWRGGSGGLPPGPPAPPGPAWSPPPVRRARSPLGRITLGLALLAGGAAWMVDLLGVGDVPVSSMLAIVLVVLGLGLLVGSVAGRARWLAAVVAVVLPVTFVVAVVEDLDIDLTAGVHARETVVLDAAQLDEQVALGAGELVLDLTGLPDDDVDDVLVDVTLGAGELHVIVPEGVGLTGRVRLEAGEVRVLDETSAGVGVERAISVPADPGRPTLTLDLRAIVGEVRVSARSVDLPDDEPGPGADASQPTDDATTEVQP